MRMGYPKTSLEAKNGWRDILPRSRKSQIFPQAISFISLNLSFCVEKEGIPREGDSYFERNIIFKGNIVPQREEFSSEGYVRSGKTEPVQLKRRNRRPYRQCGADADFPYWLSLFDCLQGLVR